MTKLPAPWRKQQSPKDIEYTWPYHSWSAGPSHSPPLNFRVEVLKESSHMRTVAVKDLWQFRELILLPISSSSGLKD